MNATALICTCSCFFVILLLYRTVLSVQRECLCRPFGLNCFHMNCIGFPDYCHQIPNLVRVSRMTHKHDIYCSDLPKLRSRSHDNTRHPRHLCESPSFLLKVSSTAPTRQLCAESARSSPPSPYSLFAHMFIEALSKPGRDPTVHASPGERATCCDDCMDRGAGLAPQPFPPVEISLRFSKLVPKDTEEPRIR